MLFQSDFIHGWSRASVGRCTQDEDLGVGSDFACMVFPCLSTNKSLRSLETSCRGEQKEAISNIPSISKKAEGIWSCVNCSPALMVGAKLEEVKRSPSPPLGCRSLGLNRGRTGVRDKCQN